MIALIDADMIVYRAAWACEKPIDWGDGTHTLHTSEADLSRAIDYLIGSIERNVGPSRLVFCLSDPKRNWRLDLYPQYKHNRKAMRKPIAWAAARRYIEGGFECLVKDRLEADDILGILMTGNVKGFAGEKVICSADKDLLQIPGKHFNWNTEDKGVFEQSAEEAELAFWTQVLAGDPTDGIPGCKGIGPKRARALVENALATVGEVWPTVVHTYRRAGFPEEYALTMARCVRILRAQDYDFKTREVRLWHPTNPSS